MIVFWLETHGVFLRFFQLFDSITSAVTTDRVGFFKPTAHVLALQKFALKEDNI